MSIFVERSCRNRRFIEVRAVVTTAQQLCGATDGRPQSSRGHAPFRRNVTEYRTVLSIFSGLGVKT
jgi:hypothetical protein